jgi:predicted transcriptional regulator YheO
LESVRDELEFLNTLLDGIAEQFGDRCEVVLHDLQLPYDRTIISIRNGHITGRTVGDCGSNLGLEVLRGTAKDGNLYNYITQTKQGKVLRSSSIYIRNSKGETIGSICINLDITDFLMAENVLKSFSRHGSKENVPEVFVKDVNELLDFLIQECQKEIGKPVAHMTKEDKMRAIEYLDRKGAFLIKKAGDKICKYFDISKFTLYSLLDEVRNSNG